MREKIALKKFGLFGGRTGTVPEPAAEDGCATDGVDFTHFQEDDRPIRPPTNRKGFFLAEAG